MRRIVTCVLATFAMGGCAHMHGETTKTDCHVESGWLDSSNGCSERAGFPDCYRVCADGSRVRVQDVGNADAAPKAASSVP